MTQIFYPRDYEENYDFLDRKIVEHLTSLFIQMDIFDTISVNHISVVGIFYCRNKNYDQVEFDAKMGYDNNDPYLVRFVWYKNNEEAPIDEILPLLAPNKSKFLLYNLDLFSKRNIDVREIRSSNN